MAGMVRAFCHFLLGTLLSIIRCELKAAAKISDASPTYVENRQTVYWYHSGVQAMGCMLCGIGALVPTEEGVNLARCSHCKRLQPRGKNAPTKPTEQLVFKNWRQESKTQWGTNQAQGSALDTERIKMGAILRAADALEDIAFQLNVIHDRLESLSKPQASGPQVPNKQEREKKSRDNALAAYIKAGGKIDDDSSEDFPRLSVRAIKTLRKLGITSVEQLVDFTEDDVLAVKNCGVVTAEELWERLDLLGLRFKEAKP